MLLASKKDDDNLVALEHTIPSEPRYTFAARWLMGSVILCCPMTLSGQGGKQVVDPGQPFLWRVEGQPPSYLFGTIHRLDQRVARPTAQLTAIMKQSDAVFTEISYAPHMLEEIRRVQHMAEGKTLQSVLPQDTYARVADYTRSKGVDIALVSTIKVWSLTHALMKLETMKGKPAHASLDQTIFKEATAMGKHVGALETTDEHVRIFESFSSEARTEILERTLDYLGNMAEQGRSHAEELIVDYLKGDTGAMLQHLNRWPGYYGNPKLERQFKTTFFDERNRRFVERMVKELRTHNERQYLFALGVGHFVGKKSILALLRQKGFTVERVSAPVPKQKDTKSGPDKEDSKGSGSAIEQKTQVRGSSCSCGLLDSMPPGGVELAHGGLPAVAEGKCAELEDALSGIGLPA